MQNSGSFISKLPEFSFITAGDNSQVPFTTSVVSPTLLGAELFV